MADVIDIAASTDAAPQAKGRKGLLFGLVGALVLGGGGFYAVHAGLLDPLLGGGEAKHAPVSVAPDVAFVAMEPIMISLPQDYVARHLRFTGQLEVDPAHRGEVELLMPRVLDVLNTYLRAVDVRDLEQPASIPKLRAQMLRRVQVVTGEGRVRDLLITEFILN